MLTVTGDATTAKTFKGVTMNIPVISVNTGKGNFPTCDGLSGTASKNADVIKEKISVDVKVVGDAKAYIYLVDALGDTKNIMTFDAFKVNTDG